MWQIIHLNYKTLCGCIVIGAWFFFIPASLHDSLFSGLHTFINIPLSFLEGCDFTFWHSFSVFTAFCYVYMGVSGNYAIPAVYGISDTMHRGYGRIVVQRVFTMDSADIYFIRSTGNHSVCSAVLTCTYWL